MIEYVQRTTRSHESSFPECHDLRAAHHPLSCGKLGYDA